MRTVVDETLSEAGILMENRAFIKKENPLKISGFLIY